MLEFTEEERNAVQNWLSTQNDVIPNRPSEWNTVAKQYHNSVYDIHTAGVLCARIEGSKIPLNTVKSVALKAMAQQACLAALQSGNAGLSSKWQLLTSFANAYDGSEVLKAADGFLVQMQAVALSDGVLSQDVIDFYTTKDGIRLEVILNKDLTGDATSIPVFQVAQFR